MTPRRGFDRALGALSFLDRAYCFMPDVLVSLLNYGALESHGLRFVHGRVSLYPLFMEGMKKRNMI